MAAVLKTDEGLALPWGFDSLPSRLRGEVEIKAEVEVGFVLTLASILTSTLFSASNPADVAELVYALHSKCSEPWLMGVRLPPSASFNGRSSNRQDI